MRAIPLAVVAALCAVPGPPGLVRAAEAPRGRASAESAECTDQKVVFDVAAGGVERVNAVLDRASHISEPTGAGPFDTAVGPVLHGDEIPFFAVGSFEDRRRLMVGAQSLTVGGVIELRMCRVAADARATRRRTSTGSSP
ncbi:MAG: hypothetical protein GWN84_12770 [Gammaproteobacteria bacterium]|nr:hypothetical protein [Gammaproteobacteria bacterium]NIR83754.1 hypothetical protein [Gammaproteobacteria bacterium]NIU05060.1 hypothetical protein [Gammaproteobacteria bacterium]NIX86333.1 hypothetical protein [Gammaproteobacteria bacterium]